MAARTQYEIGERLARETRETDARIHAAVGGLSEDQLRRQPAAEAWSIAQVLEHLCISHDSYLEPIRAILAREAPRVDPARATWKPSILGGLLARSMRSPRKLPAPRIYRPGPAPRPDVLEEFLAREREVLALLDQAVTLDWDRTRMRSPVTPLIRTNLGDAFNVLVAHAARHAGQIERIRRMLG